MAAFSSSLVVALGVLLLALFAPRLAHRPFRTAERAVTQLSHHFPVALALAGLLGLLTAAGAALLLGVPHPTVADEFSYLLAADTYSHGRLSNPTPPLWPHFETFHVLMHPTYMSKYPPAQGLTLALGQRLFNLPIAGLWIANGIVCMALCWMLRAFLPARWALLGGLLSAFNMTLLEWTHNYWGGTAAAIGGAIALGGWQRVRLEKSAGAGICFGAGLVVLALSRPYEGLALSAGLLGTLAGWAWRETAQGRGAALRRAGLGLSSALLCGAGFLALINRSVTGNPFTLPYVEYTRQYSGTPLFIFQNPVPPPTLHYANMLRFTLQQEGQHYREQRTLNGLTLNILEKTGTIALGFLRPLTLGLALLWLPAGLRREGHLREILGIGALFIAATWFETTFFPHYVSPLLAVVWLCVIQGLRRMRAWRLNGRPCGRAMMRLLLIACLFSWLKWHPDYRRLPHKGIGDQRAVLLKRLEQTPGLHLVLVHYGPNHVNDNEWVYNRANIDGSKVIWARERGDRLDDDLRAYYPQRIFWRLDADAGVPVLRRQLETPADKARP